MKKELNYLISKEEILIELKNFSISPKFIQKVQKVKQYLHIDLSRFPCPSSYCFKSKSLIGVDNILISSKFTFLPPSTIYRLGYEDFLRQEISFSGKRVFIASRSSTIKDLIASEKEEIELLISRSTSIDSSYPCYYFLITPKLSREYEIRKFYYDTEDRWFMESLVGELVDKLSITRGILIDYEN